LFNYISFVKKMLDSRLRGNDKSHLFVSVLAEEGGIDFTFCLALNVGGQKKTRCPIFFIYPPLLKDFICKGFKVGIFP
jgi:hypothetical protein